MKKYSNISILLLTILALHPFFYSCGDKAIGADGTVIAEFEWDGKQRITLEDNVNTKIKRVFMNT